MEIAAALESWLGRHLSPTAIYNHPTIADLARWLAVAPLPEKETAVGQPPDPSSRVSLDSEKLLAEVRGMTDQDLDGFVAQELRKQHDN